jgi:glycerol-3-phosphate acyltransferase PlsY
MTHSHLLLLCLALAAYAVGSIPFGLIVGLAKGIDPRKAGSGNIGATNLGRLLGGKFFALVFTLDLLKGFFPMLAAAWFVEAHFPQPDAVVYLFWMLVGFGAILGHMFSLFIGFKGGKGVATSIGVVMGLFPYYTYAGFIVTAVWLIFFFATRYVSVASIAASAAFPIAYIALALINHWPLLGQQFPLLIFTLIVGGMIIYKHRGNIARLKAGTEPKIARKAV